MYPMERQVTTKVVTMMTKRNKQKYVLIKKIIIIIALVVGVVAFGILLLDNFLLLSKSKSMSMSMPTSIQQKSKQQQQESKEQKTHIDQDGVCVNVLPYAKMYHEKLSEVKQYRTFLIHKAKAGDDGNAYTRTRTHTHSHSFAAPFFGESSTGPPELRTLPPGSNFAFWHCEQSNDLAFSCDHEAKIKGSAWTWTEDGSGSMDAFKYNNNYPHSDPRVIWVPHRKYDFLATKTTILKGDTAAMFGFWPDNFGHVLHDNLPLLAWLKATLSQHFTFALPDTKVYRDLIAFIEPQFIQRIYFYQPNEIITVQDGTLTVANPKSGKVLAYYGNTLMRYMRHWIFDNHPETYPDDEKHIIFHTRGGPRTYHGRKIDYHHEKDILAIVKDKMEKYNRKEKLIIFSGIDEKGLNILSYEEQFEIFRRASVIIGPHGSGLANVIWTHPFPKSCDDRVQMLEFIAGTDSIQVHPPNPFNGYYWVLRGMPIDWHQITYASNSTMETTYLRLNDLHRALDKMWGL